MIEGKHGKAALNAFTMQSFGSFLTNRSTVKHHALRCAMAGYGELDPAAWDTNEERWKCVEGVSIFDLRCLYQLKERERPNTRGGSCRRWRMAATTQLDGIGLDVGLSTQPLSHRYSLDAFRPRRFAFNQGDFGSSAVLHQRCWTTAEEFGEGSLEAVQRWLVWQGKSMYFVHSRLANEQTVAE